MELVNDKGVIKTIAFRCVESGHSYRITGTKNTFEGSQFWKDSAWNSIDTVVRSDGKRRDFTRQELASRFKDVRKEEPRKEKTKKEKIIEHIQYNIHGDSIKTISGGSNKRTKKKPKAIR